MLLWVKCMNKEYFIVVLICLAIVLPIVGYIVYRIDQKDKRQINTGAAIYMKRNRKRLSLSIYHFLRRFAITSNYIDKISRRYAILYPGDQRGIIAKTMNVLMLIAILSSLEIYLVFMLKPNLHNAVLSIILLYVINNEIINSQVRNSEIRLLEQMVIFISDVRHNYHVNRLVDDSIRLSLQDMNNDMRTHANKIYEIITSNKLKEEVEKYNTTTNNKYLKMFLSLCTSVIEFSDRKINGQLLFITNLEHLKREINIEILKLKKLKYVFSGSIFVAVAVCIPVDAIQGFGISLVPELESFYTGRGGILFVGLIFLSSVIVYLLINNLKELRNYIPPNHGYLKRVEKLGIIKRALNNYTEKNYGKMLMLKELLKRVGENITPKQFLLKRLLLAVITFLFCIGLAIIMHQCNIRNITRKVSNIDTMISISGRGQAEQITEIILTAVREYKEDDFNEKELQDLIISQGILSNRKLIEAISKEVYIRIKKYRSEYLHWYEWISGLIVAGIAYYIPYFMLLYKKRVLRMNMEDEVNQFNSILFMLMYINHMTLKGVLEQLELFAVVFKQSLQECINEFNSGEQEALKRMKEKESYGPFCRMVDNLIRCDAMPMEKAFDEIMSDRENYYDRRKLENEISIQKRADTIKPVSFIPAVLVTIYLLLPLLAASLKELESFRESLSSMGF